VNVWVLTSRSTGGDGWWVLGVFTSEKRAREAAQAHEEPCFVSRWKANDPRSPLGLPGPVNV
jgi:hypothetical protein